MSDAPATAVSTGLIPSFARGAQAIGLPHLPRSGWLSVAVRAALWFAALGVLATGAFILVALGEREAFLTLRETTQQQVVDLTLIRLKARLIDVVSDVRVIADEDDVRRAVSGGSPDVLTEHFSSFMRFKTDYDVLRLIGADGMELIRFARGDDDTIAPVPKDKLTSKAERYYFQDSIGLPRGSAYVSRLDLNVENGVVQQPLHPTIRFTAPIASNTGATGGLAVINYNARPLIAAIRNEAALRQSTVWLVNETGDWLMGPSPDVEWSFMFPDRPQVSFASTYPEAWQQISTAALGTHSITTPEGDFTVGATDAVNGNVLFPRLYVVTHLTEAEAKARLRDSRLEIMWWITLGIVALLSLAIGYHWHRRVASDDLIHDLNERLARDNISLGAVNKELEAFSYSVSHDLRTPLRSIDGFCQALAEDYAARLDDVGRGYLNRVRSAAQRMGQLIDDMLSLSRIGRANVRMAEIDMTALARDVASRIEDGNPSRSLDWDIAEDMRGYGDPGLTRIVLENLFGNAFKFTGKVDDARVVFGEVEKDGRTAFFVRDNGAGFDMAFADKLFGAFQRLHDARDYAGTGIGLATVQRIVNKHGGAVWAEGVPGEGATFYFTLGKDEE